MFYQTTSCEQYKGTCSATTCPFGVYDYPSMSDCVAKNMKHCCVTDKTAEAGSEEGGAGGGTGNVCVGKKDGVACSIPGGGKVTIQRGSISKEVQLTVCMDEQCIPRCEFCKTYASKGDSAKPEDKRLFESTCTISDVNEKHSQLIDGTFSCKDLVGGQEECETKNRVDETCYRGFCTGGNYCVGNLRPAAPQPPTEVERPDPIIRITDSTFDESGNVVPLGEGVCWVSCSNNAGELCTDLSMQIVPKTGTGVNCDTPELWTRIPPRNVPPNEQIVVVIAADKKLCLRGRIVRSGQVFPGYAETTKCTSLLYNRVEPSPECTSCNVMQTSFNCIMASVRCPRLNCVWDSSREQGPYCRLCTNDFQTGCRTFRTKQGCQTAQADPCNMNCEWHRGFLGIGRGCEART